MLLDTVPLTTNSVSAHIRQIWIQDQICRHLLRLICWNFALLIDTRNSLSSTPLLGFIRIILLFVFCESYSVFRNNCLQNHTTFLEIKRKQKNVEFCKIVQKTSQLKRASTLTSESDLMIYSH